MSARMLQCLCIWRSLFSAAIDEDPASRALNSVSQCAVYKVCQRRGKTAGDFGAGAAKHVNEATM